MNVPLDPNIISFLKQYLTDSIKCLPIKSRPLSRAARWVISCEIDNIMSTLRENLYNYYTLLDNTNIEPNTVKLFLNFSGLIELEIMGNTQVPCLINCSIEDDEFDILETAINRMRGITGISAYLVSRCLILQQKEGGSISINLLGITPEQNIEQKNRIIVKADGLRPFRLKKDQQHVIFHPGGPNATINAFEQFKDYIVLNFQELIMSKNLLRLQKEYLSRLSTLLGQEVIYYRGKLITSEFDSRDVDSYQEHTTDGINTKSHRIWPRVCC